MSVPQISPGVINEEARDGVRVPCILKPYFSLKLCSSEAAIWVVYFGVGFFFFVTEEIFFHQNFLHRHGLGEVQDAKYRVVFMARAL